MLSKLTEFIRLFGVAASCAIFGIIVMASGVGVDLAVHAAMGPPRPSVLEVVLAAASAGLVTALVIFPFAKSALALEAQEEALKELRGELRESELRHRDFADAASDWYWEMDQDLRFSYFSPRVEEVTGVPVAFHIGKTREELAGEAATSDKWRAHLEDLRQHRPFKNFRYARKGHDGRVQHLSTSGKPIFSPVGKFMGYRGVGADVTIQVEAEERVRDAQNLLAAAIEGMSELFVLWDPSDRLVVCNERFRETNRAVIETTASGTLFADHVRTALAAGLYPGAEGREDEWFEERMRQHASPPGPFELARQDGKWLLINEQRLPDGSTATISTDITDLKKAEQRQKESEQRLADFAAIGADWFWEQDADLRFTFVSFENEGVTGMVANAHYGKTRRETEPQDVTDEEMTAHEALLLRREPFSDFRFSRVRPDGEKAYLSISGKPIFDDDGAFKGYRGVGRDVTQLHETQVALVDARRRAEQANRAKSDFLARMSHDLRTPLNAILGFSDVIERQVEALGVEPKLGEYAGNIKFSGNVLLNLISDILDLSRIEAGRYELIERPVAIAGVFGELHTLFHDRAETAGVELDIAASNAPHSLLADRRAVLQCLMNLTGNAIKFSDPGGRVQVACELVEGAMRLSVADKGIGFDMAVIEYLLEPFGRAADQVAQAREGTGLGLAIVSSLMQLHGGRLEIDSTPGKGTVATLIFPSKRFIVSSARDTVGAAE